MKICLQSGHTNIKNNIDTQLRGATGAPNEEAFNRDICNRVAEVLEKEGHDVLVVDANANSNTKVTDVDWDLFLAVHYDADVYKDSGGFVDFAEPSTDGATKESQRIAKTLSDAYFKATGIKNMPSRSNANTRYYYMWKYLTDKTPCVLIECGVGMRKPKDYDVLHETRDLVVKGISEGILQSFGSSDNEHDKCEKKLKEYKIQRDEWKKKYKNEVEKVEEWKKVSEDRAEVISTLEKELETLQQQVKTLQTTVTTNKTPLTEYSAWERFISIFITR